MAVDPAAREELPASLRAMLGPEEAATMDALLPPDDAGTTARFDQLDAHLSDHDRRLDAIDGRLHEHDRRFDQIERHLQSLDQRMDTLRYELIAAFRGEVVSAVSGQTRAVLLGVITASVAMFGMSVGVAQLL